MTQAKNGDTVKVHYTGKLDDGTVFDTSANRHPLEFTIGEDQLLPSFEQAVVGMNPGESKIVKILADQAYGSYVEGMLVVLDRNRFPEHIEPEIGQWLKMRSPKGQTFLALVTEISELSVTLDANHPLAGKDLTFDIQLVEIA